MRLDLSSVPPVEHGALFDRVGINSPFMYRARQVIFLKGLTVTMSARHMVKHGFAPTHEVWALAPDNFNVCLIVMHLAVKSRSVGNVGDKHSWILPPGFL